MCGICGIVLPEGDKVSARALQDMADMMIHRGPDACGFLAENNFGLGFRRLSIVDVAHGHQPLSNEDRTVWVVCNGEIYNHKELRRELQSRGHIFASNVDTEVLVHLYEEYGIEFVKRIRGMFAIGLVDLNRRDVYLIRDPFGIKPLYFVESHGSLQFASDIRALLRFIPQGIGMNEQAMWDYFTLQYVPGTESLFQGVQKVQPGRYVHFKNGVSTHTRYWQPSYEPNTTLSMAEFEEQVSNALEASVRRHLQSDVPVGAFLSSGIDSTTLSVLANKYTQIDTFSVGFEDADPHLDELRVARETAQGLGLRNEQRIISSRDIETQLPAIIASLEEPLGDPSALALYFLSELAERRATVVLSGEGADEIFGGYPIYHEPKSLRPLAVLPAMSRELLHNLAEKLPYGLKGRGYLLRGTTPLERRFVGNIHVFSEESKAALLSNHAATSSFLPTFRLSDPIYARNRQHDDITKMQLVDLETWLPGDILLKADKMTMAHSLELRVPFLDLDLFNLARTIPAQYRILYGQSKYILRQAVRRWLPDEVVNRPKLGFPVPYRKWLRGPMQGLLWDALQSSRLKHMFSSAEIERMLVAHSNGTRDYGRELWTILTFLLWTHVFLEGDLGRNYGLSKARNCKDHPVDGAESAG